MMRLDKYLADMGAGTRQEVKKYIRQGLVTLEGRIIRTPEYKVNEENQQVCLKGQPVAYASFEYYMLNKPAGVVSAARDRKYQTAVDLIRSRKRKDLFPAGRLDLDTEGLLLITNDGALAHRLLAPSRHVDKTYYARVNGPVTDAEVKMFAKGVNIGSKDQEEWTRPGILEVLSSGRSSEIRLTIQEGKYHQVKRMFLSVGREVTYLKRERMGSLVLDGSLRPGEYRPLTKEELEKL